MISTQTHMTEQSRFHQHKEQIDAEQVEILSAQADARYFEPLYLRYYPRILAFVYLRLDSKETARDICAQVFCTALDKLSQYKNKGLPFSAWLFRIALNELNQYYRKSRVRRTINIDDAGEQALRDELPPVSTANLDKLLFAALQALEEDEVNLIEMRYFEKRSFKELCEINGLGESALKMRVYRLLEKLKAHLIKAEQ
jgi:RNA polymerase sigma-70 factor (ECF subfamily)